MLLVLDCMDWHTGFLIEYSVLNGYKLLLIFQVRWHALSGGRFGPALPEVATTLRVSASSILAMPLSRKRTSDAAVSHLNPKTVHPAVPHWVPGGLGGSPMGRICLPQSLLHGWTAGLQLCNCLSEIGNDFYLLLVCHDQLVNRIVLLDGCVRQVVQQCSHFLHLDNFLCGCLIGKG